MTRVFFILFNIQAMRKYVDTFAVDGNDLSLVLISGDVDFVADLSGTV